MKRLNFISKAFLAVLLLMLAVALGGTFSAVHVHTGSNYVGSGFGEGLSTGSSGGSGGGGGGGGGGCGG